jgi:hypothetical protein
MPFVLFGICPSIDTETEQSVPDGPVATALLTAIADAMPLMKVEASVNVEPEESETEQECDSEVDWDEDDEHDSSAVQLNADKTNANRTNTALIYESPSIDFESITNKRYNLYRTWQFGCQYFSYVGSLLTS